MHRVISNGMIDFCRGMDDVAGTVGKADMAYSVLFRVERLDFPVQSSQFTLDILPS